MNIFVQNRRRISNSITSAADRDIPAYFWSGDNRILYLQDSGGDENFHLFAVDANGSKARDLTPFEGARVRIVDRLEEIDDEVLIGLNRRDPRLFDVFRLNIDSGELTLVEENPGDIEGWLTDHNGKLRAAVRTDGVNQSLLYREDEGRPFKTLITTDFKETVSPLFFTFDNRELYVASNLGRNTSAIYIFNPENASLGELVFEHKEVDVYSLFRSKTEGHNRRRFTTDRFHYHFFDKEREELQKELEQRLPGYEITVTSMNRDEDKVLLHAGSDRTLGAYYFYDIRTKDFHKLADLGPWLSEEALAPMTPVKYTSRDGLVIHGYLTLPPGSGGKNLPVVINPHGGPWARDSWGYNSEAQFLANRGLAVLQMNFRGSTGYGRAFWGPAQGMGRRCRTMSGRAEWLIQQESRP